MSSPLSLIAILLAALVTFAFAQTECYFPDGTSDADGYPCNSTASVITHCCRTFEACLEKGACYTQWDSQFYRRSCTDKNWGDGCPTVCTNVDTSSPVGMLACSQGTDPTYCCDNSTSASCCAGSNVFNFIPGDFLGVIDAQGNINPPAPASTVTRTSTLNAAHSSTLSESSLSQSSTSSSTVSNVASSSQPSSSDSKSSVSSSSTISRTVGLAVGIPLGVILIVALSGLFWFFNRRLNQEKAERTKLEEKLTHFDRSSGPAEMRDNKGVLEKADGDTGHELPGTAAAVEAEPPKGRYEMGTGKSVYGDGYASGSSATRV